MKNSVKVMDASHCSIGSIVWVRRRNGSWWPGKILGSDGLSASNLMSPRSGTPVKLLGREDASVDWYNLEKSKRVKAFRCGEFDDCIQKVEASLGLPPKKREKYARREDAILHALELEKETLEKKYANTEPVCNEAGCEISDDEKKTSISYSENSARHSDDVLELASGGDERSILTPDCMDGLSRWKHKRKRNSRVRGGNNFSKVSFPRRGESLGPEDFVTAKTMLIDDNTEQDGGNHDDDDDDTIDWEESSWNEFLPSYGGEGYYWADHHHPSSHLLEHGNFRRLMDIELKVVQAATSSSNQRQHMPLISLLSNLNGHAIIGHPIHVEPLENSSSETLLLSSRQVNDETTNLRVPPHPRPSGTKKLSRKVQKKMRLSSSSSQKIKTLSSIGIGKGLPEKTNGKEVEEEKGFIKEGVLTGVACIPVKLVFSRLHEELVG